MHVALGASIFVVGLIGWSGTSLAAGDGLTPNMSPWWSPWQARLAWQAPDLNAETRLRPSYQGRSGLKAQGLGVFGDYYFARAPLGRTGAGGFRATTGLLLGDGPSWWSHGGPRPRAGTGSGLHATDRRDEWSADGDLSEVAQPYLGVGYSGLSSKGGWGLAADVGLLARHAGSSIRFGRAEYLAPGQDDSLRELRWLPVLQLGVSYSF